MPSPGDYDGYGGPPNETPEAGDDHPSQEAAPDEQFRVSHPPGQNTEGYDDKSNGRAYHAERRDSQQDEHYRTGPSEHEAFAPHEALSVETSFTPHYPRDSPSLSALGLHAMGSPPRSQPLQAAFDPYAPANNEAQVHDRNDSNDRYVSNEEYAATKSYSAFSSSVHHSHIPQRPAPAQQSHQTPSMYEPSSYVPSSLPHDAYNRASSPTFYSSPPPTGYFQTSHVQDDTYVPQQVLDQRPISEDPLGRSTLAARNIPLAVFGFGGVMITAFPAAADDDSDVGHSRTPSYGYASGRGQLWIRKVSDIVSDGALGASGVAFPGPLVLDPATPKGLAADKKKREAVMTYLEARAEEIEKGLPYLKSSASRARREEEGKLVLVRLLAAMVIGEGKLSGRSGRILDSGTSMLKWCSAKIEDAIRTALMNPSQTSPNPSVSPKAAAPANNAYGSLYPPAASWTASPAVASPAQLAELSRMLLSGDKRDATQYAAANGLWSHALIVSSCVDQELWKEIVSRFASAELSGNVVGTAAMKASYALFSGSTAVSGDFA